MKSKQYDIILVHEETWMASNSGLAALDAYLNHNGMKSVIINGSELEDYIDLSDNFGFSVLNLNYPFVQKLTRKLKSKKIIWGGWAVTAAPEKMLNDNPEVDIIILREGEKRLLDLLKSFENPEIFHTIDGIGYRTENDEIKIIPAESFMNMDELPKQGKLSLVGEIVFIELSRGCYGGCHYCQDVSTMRFKSASRITDEIESWIQDGYTTFHLGNANSIANGKLLKELFTILEKRKLEIELSLVGRPEDVLRHFEAVEFLFKAKYIRPYAIAMGVESNSQRVLDLLGRKMSVETNQKALHSLQKLRDNHAPEVRLLAYMILFSHYDMSLEDFAANVDFICSFGCSEDVISLYLIGLRDTVIWDDMNKRGFIKNENAPLQIMRYPFTDPEVSELFKRLVLRPLKTKLKNNEFSDLKDNMKLQKEIMIKLNEFYNSGNTVDALREYLSKTDMDAVLKAAMTSLH